MPFGTATNRSVFLRNLALNGIHALKPNEMPYLLFDHLSGICQLVQVHKLVVFADIVTSGSGSLDCIQQRGRGLLWILVLLIDFFILATLWKWFTGRCIEDSCVHAYYVHRIY